MNALPTFLKPRLVHLYVFLFCAAMIAIAIAMEIVLELEPCPLCIMQRVFFIATGLVALAGAIHNPSSPRGRAIYGLLATAMAVIGGGFATRQIWLQSLPADQVPACQPSIGYMLEANFPLNKVLKVLLSGDGSCAEITWRDPLFNFFTIPQLSLLGFVMLAGVCLWQAARKQ
ncbi:MAG TPA: disulfide bond formation protein B [Candidatus Acidoferrum sp.]|nr:disulfide bond formation protein B [Candidatus Acidoferrum sp.]